MAVLLPHGAFPTEDRLTFTHETAEPLGVSPPEAVDSLLIEELHAKLQEHFEQCPPAPSR